MDAFEAARAKYEKNKAARERSAANAVSGSEPEEKVVFIEAPKEKVRMQDAVIEVNILLPDAEYSFRLTKPQIYQNATRSQLTRQEFINRVRAGLEPLLGGLKG